ncbi:MAG: glycosyltransferase family 2 protein [Opitutae bacterium]|nr:glycosyltransferase family 2 protein [Opitutae bacterium]
MISVFILTLNEEHNIEECLSSVEFSDDVIVLDSFSKDNTVGKAEALGAKVYQRKFDNYAAQRNHGLSLNFKYDWILMIDADERVSDELREEITEIIHLKGNSNSLYRFRRKDFFMNKWIKHSSGYPTWFGRLMKKGEVEVRREINEEYYTNGEVGFLKGHLIHYPFNKGIEYWFERHNKYSTMEAKRLLGESVCLADLKNFFHKDPMIRRKIFKSLAYKVPCRPILTFIFLYIFKLGILDGLAGFHYSLMRSIYEYQIDLKMKELKDSKLK